MSAWRWIWHADKDPLVVDLSSQDSSIKIVNFLLAIGYTPSDRWPKVRRQP